MRLSRTFDPSTPYQSFHMMSRMREQSKRKKNLDRKQVCKSLMLRMHRSKLLVEAEATHLAAGGRLESIDE